MSTIVIARQSDGLPLVASLEQSLFEGLEVDNSRMSNEVRKMIKHLLRLISINAGNRFPSAMSLRSHFDRILFHYLIQDGVVFLMVTDGHSSRLISFATLLELAQEFFKNYSSDMIQATARPYAFMSFETNIHKARKECSNPNYLRHHLLKLSDRLQAIPSEDWRDYTDSSLYHSHLTSSDETMASQELETTTTTTQLSLVSWFLGELRDFKADLSNRWFFILSTYLLMHCLFVVVPWTFTTNQLIVDGTNRTIVLKSFAPIRFVFGLTGVFGLCLVVQMVLLAYEYQRKWLTRCLSVSMGFSSIFITMTFISRLRNEFPLSQFSWTRLFFLTWLPFSLFMRTSSRVYADQKTHLHNERHSD